MTKSPFTPKFIEFLESMHFEARVHLVSDTWYCEVHDSNNNRVVTLHKQNGYCMGIYFEGQSVETLDHGLTTARKLIKLHVAELEQAEVQRIVDASPEAKQQLCDLMDEMDAEDAAEAQAASEEPNAELDANLVANGLVQAPVTENDVDAEGNYNGENFPATPENIALVHVSLNEARANFWKAKAAGERHNAGMYATIAMGCIAQLKYMGEDITGMTYSGEPMEIAEPVKPAQPQQDTQILAAQVEPKPSIFSRLKAHTGDIACCAGFAVYTCTLFSAILFP